MMSKMPEWIVVPLGEGARCVCEVELVLKINIRQNVN